MPRALVGVAIACAVLGAGWLLLAGSDVGTKPSVETSVDAVDGVSSAPDVPVVADSPFAAVDPGAERAVPAGTVPDGGAGVSIPGPIASDGAAIAEVAPVVGTVDIQALGRDPMSDAEFDALLARLDADPDLLDALIQELRGESDAARIERLSLLLGDLDHPDVTALAVELAYSSDPALRAAGLDLLQRTGDGSLAERDAVVSGLLSTETDPEILMSALGAIARPGNVDASTRASMVTQVTLLTGHEEASVRRGSIEIVSRWTRDGSDTPVLLGGLTDEDASVRRGAAYAFVGHEAIDDQVRRELLRVAEDGAEALETRSAALLALRRSGAGDEAFRAELDRLQRRLDRGARGDRAG